MFIVRPVLGALVLLFIYLFPPLVLGGVVNFTIDDTFGDSSTGRLVTYFPATPNKPWGNAFCGDCHAIEPDTSQAFRQTFTAATWYPTNGLMSITMQFNGTAIYVFFILANNAGEGITSLTSANFTLDDNIPELFEHVPDSQSTDILYNQLVFNRANLTNTNHTLVISASQPTPAVYVDFDYAIYTHEDETDPNPSSSSRTVPSTNLSTLPTSVNKLVEVTTSPKDAASTSTANESASVFSVTPSSSSSLLPLSSKSSTSLESDATQSETTSASKKSIAIAPVAGAIAGIMLFSLFVVLGVFWLQRRHKRRSLEIPRHFPIMTELPGVNQATSTVHSNVATSRRVSRKLEEIDRARQLSLHQLPALVEEDAASLTSETNQATHGHRLSMEAYSNVHESISVRDDIEYNGLVAGELDQHFDQLHRQSLYLGGQQQTSSTEGLLANAPPPKYQLS